MKKKKKKGKNTSFQLKAFMLNQASRQCWKTRFETFYLHDTWLLPLDLEVSLQATGAKSGKFWQQVCEGQGKIHCSKQTTAQRWKTGRGEKEKGGGDGIEMDINIQPKGIRLQVTIRQESTIAQSQSQI